MFSTITQRPRNIDTWRAAALLYGDLGTSKAYVIGLAFALAGYASFWLILAVSLLTILIGINYTVICKYYPNGGGVYASVRKRSEALSLMGAFFIIADYLVTAALSALSAFHYLNVPDPLLFSIIGILCVGILNYFGPRHTGSIAFVIGLSAFFFLTILIFFSLPEIKIAWHHIKPLTGKPWTIWNNFVGVIVALSGIEAIANITGVMKLNPQSTMENPRVSKTASKAIYIVIAEVALYTLFFAFIASAIGNFQIHGGEVDAPGYPNVRDSLLRYLSQIFVGQALGETAGLVFAWVLSLSIAILLLSAVNTAINGLIALLYVMASDGECPHTFHKMNRFGVPLIPLALATLIPMALILTVRNVTGLATLYAVGFVGAIATNLGSTSTDSSLPLKLWERILMGLSALIMIAIEMTLLIEKPHARFYALGIILAGLLLRVFSKKKKEVIEMVSEKTIPFVEEKTLSLNQHSILCPIHKKGLALEVALKRSQQTNSILHILFIDEQSIISEKDLEKNWEKDTRAVEISTYAMKVGKKELLHFHYCISDSILDMIAAYSLRFDVREIILEKPSKLRKITHFLRGNKLDHLKTLLPVDVHIYIVT